MKKLLGILVLGLLWCSASFASCIDELDFNWDTYKQPDYASFEIKSTSDVWIKLYTLKIITSDKRTIKVLLEESDDFYIQPFGVKYKQFYIGDINQDMIKSASYNCRFEIPQVKERKKPKKKKSGAKKLLEKIIGD